MSDWLEAQMVALKLTHGFTPSDAYYSWGSHIVVPSLSDDILAGSIIFLITDDRDWHSAHLRCCAREADKRHTMKPFMDHIKKFKKFVDRNGNK